MRAETRGEDIRRAARTARPRDRVRERAAHREAWRARVCVRPLVRCVEPGTRIPTGTHRRNLLSLGWRRNSLCDQLWFRRLLLGIAARHRSISLDAPAKTQARVPPRDALTLRGANLSIKYCPRAGVAQW